jgi:3-deoxy-D-manno-octulosonate 8-phosphate phosphatase (KDO 8-P phosphatase)
MICPPGLESEMQERAKKVKVILMDVDGVLTNMEIVYNSGGQEIKFFNSHDGLGIRLVHETGLKTGLISARDSEAIRIRASELKIEYLYLGKYHKAKSYEHFKENSGFSDEEVCFVGDDLPDVPVLQQVGFPVAVQNATPPTKEIAKFITEKEGGRGAVREIMEFILQTQGNLNKAMEYITRLDR